MNCPRHNKPMRELPVVQKHRARSFICDKCAREARLAPKKQEPRDGRR